MFWTRLGSGILLVLAAVLLLGTGGDILLGGLLVISLIGMSELYKVMNIHRCLLGAVGYLACAVYYILLYLHGAGADDRISVLFFVLFLMALMAVYVFTFPKFRSEQVMTGFFGLVYVAVMLSCIYLVRIQDGGSYLVWLVFLGSWGADTCAYAVGMLFGRHKMAPKLSPKKSVEGAIGGVAGSGILGAVFGAVFGGMLDGALHQPIIDCAVICMVGALISMIGDLAASAIKRNHEVKDYGKLIPGHGGILDRFDSVIFVAPAIYMTIMILRDGFGSLI